MPRRHDHSVAPAQHPAERDCGLDTGRGQLVAIVVRVAAQFHVTSHRSLSIDLPILLSWPGSHNGLKPPIFLSVPLTTDNMHPRAFSAGGAYVPIWAGSEGLGCVSCLVRLVASRLLSHGDDSLPLGVSVSEVAHSLRDLVERVGPVYDGG